MVGWKWHAKCEAAEHETDGSDELGGYAWWRSLGAKPWRSARARFSPTCLPLAPFARRARTRSPSPITSTCPRSIRRTGPPPSIRPSRRSIAPFSTNISGRRRISRSSPAFSPHGAGTTTRRSFGWTFARTSNGRTGRRSRPRMSSGRSNAPARKTAPTPFRSSGRPLETTRSTGTGSPRTPSASSRPSSCGWRS